MAQSPSKDRARRKLPPGKARRAIDAIVACLEYEDLQGSDRVALEDARAALDSYDQS